MAPTNTPPLSLAEQTLDNTVGAVLLGVIGASLLFGITTLQAYWYYHSYPYDSLLHKYSVAILWYVDGIWTEDRERPKLKLWIRILDVFHLSLVIHAVYTYAVSGFGNSTGLLSIPWLYAMRVWLLGGYHRGVLGYIVASVVVAGFVRLAFIGLNGSLDSSSYWCDTILLDVADIICSYTVDTIPELEKISWVIDAALGTSTAIDFVITAAMCYYLRKSKGGITRLNSRISVIMQYSLSSGLLTSACSLSAMFTYILLPNTFIFIALEFLVTKLYVGSFIAMLNARERKIGISSYSEDNYTQPSWKRPLHSHTTSSFWSPRPDSLTLSVKFPVS
ncbi:hypothetical protein CVT25_004927 [Psilocybe cyanescens]|uniref:DUF6534 domain-containing protein n=1 Tax=Psilocybe cyanescens TaxID=93625 RepID=A0A409XU65_PSICY|nr:hypothetical protein CVT25_004927 [Psilocybe cyanescens]